MKPTIEHPKVFISYAWGSKEYQARVLSLARDLYSDGIEVLLDKWNLKEGHDTYAYMEKSVNDTEVTNVLILLDPIYAQKANERTGGVGTETQIISPEIYNKVTQEKFLPIVMERGENNSVPKPSYLKALLHFDLSKPDCYDEEYQRLVKRLYGIEVVKKPDLGKMPSWVTETDTLPSRIRTALSAIKQISNTTEQRAVYIEHLNILRNNVCQFSCTEEKRHAQYVELITYRDEYLQLLKISLSVHGSHVLICDFLQELYDDINSSDQIIHNKELKQVLLHEIYIYTIAYYYKTKNYSLLQYTLNRTYFGTHYRGGVQETGIHIFYKHSQLLDAAKCDADGKNYYSGTAQQWIENISYEICNKKEFVFADILICNYAFYGKNYTYDWKWFPITYVYAEESGSILQKLTASFKSKEIASVWMRILGHENLDAFKRKISEVNSLIHKNRKSKPGYTMAFDEAPLFDDYITSEEIGSLL